MKNSIFYGLSIVGTGVLGSMSEVQADCPCSQNQQHVTYESPYVNNQVHQAPVVMQPTTVYPPPATFQGDMNPSYPQMMGQAYPSSQHMMNMNLYNDLTHYRTAREIPADKPPRVGMVDIKVAGAANVKVYDTHPFREEDLLEGYQDKHDPGVWRFESKPLIDGIPHIYKIVAFDANGATQSRYIRLVPGRVVEVGF